MARYSTYCRRFSSGGFLLQHEASGRKPKDGAIAKRTKANGLQKPKMRKQEGANKKASQLNPKKTTTGV